MNRYGFEADFENLKTVLQGGRGHRVPNAELVIDREIKERFLGRAVDTVADEIELRYQAGYHDLRLSVGMIDPAGTVNKDLLPDGRDKQFAGEEARVWAEEHLKPGMKVSAVLGKIFTAAWELLGFTRFCELLHTRPGLIDSPIERIGTIQVNVFERLVGRAEVGAFWIPDDIAFRSGTLRALVKDRIERLGHEGACCVGSSNSLPNYVPEENYRLMLETSAEFTRCPGS